jgi:hypothetical protein
LMRRDGAVILIFSQTNGAWKGQVKPSSAYAESAY